MQVGPETCPPLKGCSEETLEELQRREEKGCLHPRAPELGSWGVGALGEMGREAPSSCQLVRVLSKCEAEGGGRKGREMVLVRLLLTLE